MTDVWSTREPKNRMAASNLPLPTVPTTAQVDPNPNRLPDWFNRLFRGKPAQIMQELLVSVGDNLYMMTGLGLRPNEFRFLPPDDIIRQKGWKELKAVRNDDSVKSALAFKKLLVGGRDVSVLPYKEKGQKEATQAAKDQARFIEWMFGRLDMKTIIWNALSAFDYGHSVAELIWENAEWEGQRVIALKDIRFRDPEWMDVIAEPGGTITGFEQRMHWVFGRPVTALQPENQPAWLIRLPVEKSFHYAYQSEFQNHYGISDLRAIYKNWWAKRFILQYWNVFLEQYGMPTKVMKYPQGADPRLQQTLIQILQNLGAKNEILIPTGVELDLLEASRGGTASYKEAMDYQDAAIWRGVLLPGLFGSGDNIQRGADSQSTIQLRMVFRMADFLGKQLMWCVNDQIVKRSIAYNFSQPFYPCAQFAGYGDFEADKLLDAIRLVFNAGILDMDQEDVNFVRGVIGMRSRGEGEEDEVLRPNPAPMGQSGMGAGAAGGPGGKPSQGNENATK